MIDPQGLARKIADAQKNESSPLSMPSSWAFSQRQAHSSTPSPKEDSP